MNEKILALVEWISKQKIGVGPNNTDEDKVLRNGENKKLLSYSYNVVSGTNIKRQFAIKLCFEDYSNYNFDTTNIVDFIDNGNNCCVVYRDENENERRLILHIGQIENESITKEEHINDNHSDETNFLQMSISLKNNKIASDFFKNEDVSKYVVLKNVYLGTEVFQKIYSNITKTSDESFIWILDENQSNDNIIGNDYVDDYEAKLWTPSWSDSNILIINKGNISIIIFPKKDYDIELIKKISETREQLNTISKKYDKKSTIEDIIDGTNEKENINNQEEKTYMDEEVIEENEEIKETLMKESEIEDDDSCECNVYKAMAKEMREHQISDIHFWNEDGKIYCDVRLNMVYEGD